MRRAWSIWAAAHPAPARAAIGAMLLGALIGLVIPWAIAIGARP